MLTVFCLTDYMFMCSWHRYFNVYLHAIFAFRTYKWVNLLCFRSKHISWIVNCRFYVWFDYSYWFCWLQHTIIFVISVLCQFPYIICRYFLFVRFLWLSLIVHTLLVHLKIMYTNKNIPLTILHRNKCERLFMHFTV